MVHIQTFLTCGLSEGTEIAREIAQLMRKIYGREYVPTDTVLWGVSIEVIDEPEPEAGYEGFHGLLEDDADVSWSNHRATENFPF